MLDGVLLDGEVLEPLDDKYSIIQPTDGYRFGADAVALAKFAADHVRRDQTVFELCSGCGVIGIMLAAATGARVTGAELDEALCDMSNRSAKLDGLDNVKFLNCDIRGGEALIEYAGACDAVVCNPPFFKADSRARKVAPGANCELTLEFSQVVAAAKKLLKHGGDFLLVFTASRMDEALCTCRDAGLMPKKLVINKNAKTFLLRCVRGGKPGMTAEVGEF